MKKINEYLIVMIFILTAILAAVVGLKAYEIYDTDRQLAKEQEELELAQVFERNREAQSRVQEMQAEIMERKEDKAELEHFIAQIQSGGRQGSVARPSDGSVSVNETVSGNYAVSGNETVSGNYAVSGNETVSGNLGVSGNETVSGNLAVLGNETVSGRPAVWNYASGSITLSDNGTVSGNVTVSGNATVSNNAVLPGNGTVSANTTVSGNGKINYYDSTMTENSIFDAWRNIYEQPDGMSLAQRRELRTSLQETLEVNQSDRERIAENQYDFTGLKIACLGDSITAASNLESEEGYQQYSYPARLKELLDAEEVYNLGIGGSSVGRYWSDPYVERYQEIPEDTDVIIVMGGTNDGFCVSDKEFGNLEERAYRTFCGDLDELMRGLRENYPDAEIFFATPLPNVLQDYLMTERDYLLPQQKFVDVILTLAQEYDYEVIDLYNSNILDSHDANIVAEYIPDGVHGNYAGYQIIAEHFAAEIIEHYDESAAEGRESEETDAAEEETDPDEINGTKEDTESEDMKEENGDSHGKRL